MAPFHLPDAVVVLANWFQFGKGQQLGLRNVQTRFLVWGKAGRGLIRVNGQAFAVKPGDYLLAPWGHDIDYEADRVSPFLVAGIHLVPWHHPQRRVAFSIEHGKGAGRPRRWRRDASWPGFSSPVAGNFQHDAGLRHLAEYIVLRFAREKPQPDAMRQLARTLVEEIQSGLNHPASAAVPGPLSRIKLYIHDHLHQRLSLDDLVSFSNLSGSTIHRLFIKHHGISPKMWIARQKASRAMDLLRSTDLDFREIARQLGMDDVFYFSRFFKKHTGESPSRFRQRASLF